jgi:prophage regulatory protein
MIKTRAGDLVEGGSRRTRTIIRRSAVEAKTGLRRSAIYSAMSRGTFPRQVPLGAKAVGWLEDEIDEWIRARIAERDTEAA